MSRSRTGDGGSSADIHTVAIEDLTHDGLGIGSVDGRRTFVPGALPGETVRIRRRRRRRRYVEAELLEVLEASPDRVEPECPYFGRCGGCALQHMAYSAQLAFKQKVVADAFRSIASLEPQSWLDPITGPQWGYRRRARLGVKYVEGKQRVLVGFRERAAPYVTDMDHCPVLAPQAGDSLGELAQTLHATSIRDRIPQVEVSLGDTGGALVVRVLDPPSADDRALMSRFAQRHGFDLYLQSAGPDTVAPVNDVPAELSYSLGRYGLRFQFEPNDFIQINGRVNDAMVEAAIASAGLEDDDRVLDLYCGLGNFSLPIAQRVREVVGVEGDGALVARAVRNAANNQVSNARFITADLSLPDWPFFREEWDVVFLDPARAGAEPAAQSMSRMHPRRVVYISCHPGTLARDADTLVHSQGYALSSVRVLDMFPNTHHVEAIAVFERT